MSQAVVQGSTEGRAESGRSDPLQASLRRRAALKDVHREKPDYGRCQASGTLTASPDHFLISSAAVPPTRVLHDRLSSPSRTQTLSPVLPRSVVAQVCSCRNPKASHGLVCLPFSPCILGLSSQVFGGQQSGHGSKEPHFLPSLPHSQATILVRPAADPERPLCDVLEPRQISGEVSETAADS